MSARTYADRAAGFSASPADRPVCIAVALVVLLAAAVGLRVALLQIHVSWTGKYGHFAHGYMVLGFSIWLGLRAWRRRGDLLLKPDWRTLPVLIALIGMLFVAMRLDITTATQSLVPAILISAFGLAFGSGLVRILWWPAFCVYFAMPIWYVLNTPLQHLTGMVCGVLVSLAGLPAVVEGNQFELPSGIIEVASGCSGLNYLVSALSLAYLYGMLFLQTWPARLKLLAVAFAAALVVNWARVFSLICIAYATDMRHYLIRVDHLYYGWMLFALALWPIFWAGGRLDRQEARMGIREVPAPEVAALLQVDAGGVAMGGFVAAACTLLPLLDPLF